MRVLIIESEASRRERLRELLEPEVTHCVAVDSGNTALNHLEEPFDLCVLDHEMAGKPVYEMLIEMKVAQPEAELVVYAGEDDPTHESVAKVMGADHFILKHHKDATLVDFVTRRVKQRRGRA